MTFKSPKGPVIPSARKKIVEHHHYHHDPVDPGVNYQAFLSERPVLAVFIEGHFGKVVRTGRFDVLEVDKQQALNLAVQLISYAKLPDGTAKVVAFEGAGCGGASAFGSPA